MSMVYITGLFGLILLPFVFAVVTRSMPSHSSTEVASWEIVFIRYVDDSMGVRLNSQLATSRYLLVPYARWLNCY